MRKISTVVVIICGMAVTNAHAAAGCTVYTCSTDATPDSTCSNEAKCNACTEPLDDPMSSKVGYMATKSGKWGPASCPTSGTYSCTCNNITINYTCATGYYGTANSDGTDGCTKCPDNATCAGGNGSTFSCNSGYYKNGSVCTQCPSSGGTAGKSVAGAILITQCYIPAGTGFADDNGNGTYTSNCYYTN